MSGAPALDTEQDFGTITIHGIQLLDTSADFQKVASGFRAVRSIPLFGLATLDLTDTSSSLLKQNPILRRRELYYAGLAKLWKPVDEWEGQIIAPPYTYDLAKFDAARSKGKSISQALEAAGAGDSLIGPAIEREKRAFEAFARGDFAGEDLKQLGQRAGLSQTDIDTLTKGNGAMDPTVNKDVADRLRTAFGNAAAQDQHAKGSTLSRVLKPVGIVGVIGAVGAGIFFGVRRLMK